MKFRVTSPAFIVTALLLLAGTLWLMGEADAWFWGIVLMPFAFGPLIVSLVISAISRYRPCQWILVVSSVLYAGWFWFMYLYAMSWNPGAQSALFVMVVGVYSLPVMIPVWLVTLRWRRNSIKNGEQDVGGDGG